MKRHRAMAAVFLVVAGGTLAGCSAISEATDDGDSFKDRQSAIDAVYEQGKMSRKSMEKVGVIVNETSCGSSWETSGAKPEHLPKNTTRENNDYFQEMRRLSFVNGCMDRPNSLPPIDAPALGTPTPAPSSASPRP